MRVRIELSLSCDHSRVLVSGWNFGVEGGVVLLLGCVVFAG